MAGPRQVGKTTLVGQVLASRPGEQLFLSADEPTLRDAAWLAAQWERARDLAGRADTVLALDEVQKIPSWSETVKRLWDEDTRAGRDLQVVLLGGGGMLTGLQKFTGRKVRRRASSPKLQVLDTSLMNALSGLDPDEARSDGARWGRVVESAVGAHLAAAAARGDAELFSWRDGNREVDFVIRRGKVVVAIEVKSGPRTGHRSGHRSGLQAFSDAHAPTRVLLVGAEGVPLDEFLVRPVTDWLKP